MATWAELAAANNAEWCDIVCRSHGLAPRVDAAAWTSRSRTPPLYPDAITLSPSADASAVLAKIDASPGCSIKDSFASLDLTADGFRVLFDAQWIVRAEPRPRLVDLAGWRTVVDLASFERWVDAWADDGDTKSLLRPQLLDDDRVVITGAWSSDRFVAGAIFNRSASVVGVSNFFAEDRTASTSWTACVAFADALFPDATFVGYESGDRLSAAAVDGFEAAGPLRVWTCES